MLYKVMMHEGGGPVLLMGSCYIHSKLFVCVGGGVCGWWA